VRTDHLAFTHRILRSTARIIYSKSLLEAITVNMWPKLWRFGVSRMRSDSEIILLILLVTILNAGEE